MHKVDSEMRNHAGPYGFTRREVGVILVVIVACAVVFAYTEWRDNRRPTAAWTIEDVRIETATPDNSTDSLGVLQGSNTSRTTIRGQADPVDINTADQRALTRLPGIGAELARRIIDERDANGTFINLTDLQRVNGIGPSKAATLSGWVTFSSDVPRTEDTLEAP